MDDLITTVAREVRKKFYGKHRGIVADNKDPDGAGRLRLKVPSVLADQVSGWALPCVPFGGRPSEGWFAIPELNAQVWVEFEEGDIQRPIWTGTFWQKGADVPKDAQLPEPTTRLLQTPSGHILQLDDKKDAERVRIHHAGGAEILVNEKGAIQITDQKGGTVVLDADAGEIRIEDTNGNSLTMTSSGTTVEDANGNTIEMAAAGVTVKGQKIVIEGTQVMLGGAGGEPIIKGSSFLALFATHIHTAPPLGGPTSPPIPQGEASSLSTAVTTK